MKIQNDLLTGVISNPEQVKKTGQTQPESDFAALFAEELSQATETGKMMPGMMGANPLAGLTGLMGSQPTAAATASVFSAEENEFMDEVSDLLNAVDSYSLALAGDGMGEGDAGLKSAYNLLNTIGNKTEELKGVLSKMGNNPVLSSLVNELEVMATTEKFKLNRGDYSV